MEAPDGYRDLIDYWERTGSWVQQWTTLRNLAQLLRALGDEETAALLDAARRPRSDAPAVVQVSTDRGNAALRKSRGSRRLRRAGPPSISGSAR